MLNQIHLLLTYRCDFECDHCFLYCSPRAKGTFTRKQIAEILEQAEGLGTIEWIYFEGGEPFLVYPLMIEGIRMASAKGFKTGIVTNGNWAVSAEDARIWLEPLCELGVADLSMSNDGFHGSERADAHKRRGKRPAQWRSHHRRRRRVPRTRRRPLDWRSAVIAVARVHRMPLRGSGDAGTGSRRLFRQRPVLPGTEHRQPVENATVPTIRRVPGAVASDMRPPG